MADKTRKILFTTMATYQTSPPEVFNAGDVKVMRDDLAIRWIIRGVATDDAELIAAAEAAAKGGTRVAIEKPSEKLPEGVPADWRTLSAREAMTLAHKVCGAAVINVQNRSQAIAAIEAAVAEFNKPATA